MGDLSHVRGLNEPEDVSIRIPDVELSPVRHDPKTDRDACTRGGELLGERLGIEDSEASIKVLRSLERLLVPPRAGCLAAPP